ncbi:CRISPR-associated helicase Cas3' [Streptomyces sp. NPDC059215]|uniref:CRISPR-associated helicase Cas3' n=1 Tax=Streptomyces sp. NPDC059215 TaxID=3346772 RepID=UPI0036B580F5
MRRRPDVVPDETVWGKSRGLDPRLSAYPLVRHLLDAAAVALYLWDHCLAENQRHAIAEGFGLAEDLGQARALTALCAGLHDIGKISGFQFCDARGWEALSDELVADPGKIGVERVSHDVAGMEAAPAVLEALGFGRSGDQAVERIAEVIGGHHGLFHRLDPQRTSVFHQPHFGGAAWERQREAHVAAVFDVLGEPPAPSRFGAPAAVLVTGVVILADWLVSQEGYLRRRQQSLDPSLGRHFAASCADAEALVREAGLVPVELERKEFAEAYGIDGEPNPLQRSIAEELGGRLSADRRGRGPAGIMLVTAAPGDGKTEAALEAERVMARAFGTRGFAFLLPTMATSDQMHGRVVQILARQDGSGAGLTLTHSMAWLSSAYADEDLQAGDAVLVCDGDESAESAGAEVARRVAAMRPTRWLRGAKRPLLAQYTVGTIDQALMAVLPVRHNALRLLALCGKTFIVDEAHAYDPYMQVLLGRLLNWLGAYGVPVVLLSATLPVSVSDKLIKEYLRGAGHRPKALRSRSFRAPYPGWLYVDGQDARCLQIDPQHQLEQAAERRMELSVRVEPVAHAPRGGERERLAVIERLVEPVVTDEGGCVLVVCNTVRQAQETYRHLKARYGGRGLAVPETGRAEDELQLLHARFPGDVREARTRAVTSGMGRGGPRPNRRVIVATQVVEQSLDLDADLVISDLAPLALLLQRAGRCWRHETWWARHGYPGGRERPAWASATGPRLVVLDPVVGQGEIPRQWGEVYAEFLLTETSTTLAKRGPDAISIPEDVQDLVEDVHGDRDGRFDWDNPATAAAWTAHTGQTIAQQGVAGLLAIPRARQVSNLHTLHHLQGQEDEWEAATRLGADSVRLLCVYAHEGGTLTLDLAGEQPLPTADGKRRIALSDVRTIMGRTIPVNADWFRGEREAHQAPEDWADHPMLGDLVVLRQPVRDGVAKAVEVGRHQLRLDEELGLLRD